MWDGTRDAHLQYNPSPVRKLRNYNLKAPYTIRDSHVTSSPK